MLIGTLLSPYIFDALKYYGCYSLAIILNAIVLAYFVFAVKEIPKPVIKQRCEVCNQNHKEHVHTCEALLTNDPPPPYQLPWTVNGDTTSNESEISGNGRLCCTHLVSMLKNYIFIPIWTFMLQPCTEMIQTIIRRREGHLRLLILIIISVYSLFWFAVEEMLMQYNYLLAAFPSFDGEDMAWFSTTSYLCSK